MQQEHVADSHVQGWTFPPPGRGSLDIIFSCLATVALCSWSAVAINIPAPSDSFRRKFIRKLWLSFIGILAPEFLFLIALGQYNSARRSVRSFRAFEFKKWSVRHGFYVDMGGFALMTSDGTRVPLSTRSLQWLLSQGFIPVDQFQKEIALHENVIEDRNTSDSLIRVVALIQALWFCIICGGRISQNLPLTTLELLVLAFFLPTVGTYLVWRRKPCDINTSYTIALNVTMDFVREKAGQSHKVWHNNPFDFCDREEWHPSVLYQYWLNILRVLVHPARWFARGRRRPGVPIQRRSDSELHHMPIRVGMFEAILAVPYLAANFAAWNWQFPTPLERFLWRLSAMILIITYCLSPMIHILFDTIWTPDHQKQRLQKYRRDQERKQFEDINLDEREEMGLQQAKGSAGGAYQKYQVIAARLRNSSPTDDPDMDVPLRLVVVGSLLAAVYALARTYLLVQSFTSFRAMPAAVYQTVDWQKVTSGR